MHKKKTFWERVKRQVKILICWLRDLLVLEQSPFDDDNEPPCNLQPAT